MAGREAVRTAEKGQLLAEARTLVSGPEERVGRRKFSGLVLNPLCRISEILRVSSVHPGVVPGSIIAEKELEARQMPSLPPQATLPSPRPLPPPARTRGREGGLLKAVLRHQAQSSEAACPVSFHQPGRQCRHWPHPEPVGGQGRHLSLGTHALCLH